MRAVVGLRDGREARGGARLRILPRDEAHEHCLSRLAQGYDERVQRIGGVRVGRVGDQHVSSAESVLLWNGVALDEAEQLERFVARLPRKALRNALLDDEVRPKLEGARRVLRTHVLRAVALRRVRNLHLDGPRVLELRDALRRRGVHVVLALAAQVR